jgi:hypothetical protein
MRQCQTLTKSKKIVVGLVLRTLISMPKEVYKKKKKNKKKQK